MQPINDKQHPEGQMRQNLIDEDLKRQVMICLIRLGVIPAGEETRQNLIDEDLKRQVMICLIRLGVAPADEQTRKRIIYEEEMKHYVTDCLVKFGAVPADEQTRQKRISEDLERRIKNILVKLGVAATYEDANSKILSERRGGNSHD